MQDKDQLRNDRFALVLEIEKAGGKFKGNNCNCPFHDDKHPSAGIYQQEGVWRFKCHKCGVGGDVFDMKALNKGVPVEDILAEECSGIPVKVKENTAHDEKPARFKTIEELESSLPGKHEKTYVYSKPNTGETDMIVLRASTATGKTFRMAHKKGNEYIMKAPPKPWPLYRRDLIAASDEIIITEGEKAAEALIDIGFAATTAPGGSGKAGLCDWSPLEGKKVILWPDNDEPGANHMDSVQEILLQFDNPPQIKRLAPAEILLEAKEDAYDFVQRWSDDPKAAVEVACDCAAKVKGLEYCLRDAIIDVKEGRLESIELPFTQLTHLSMPLLPKTICLICGEPGAGKSFFLLQCILHWLNTGVKFACYMLEETLEFHLFRALSLLEDDNRFLNFKTLKECADQGLAAFDRNEYILGKLSRCLWTIPQSQVSYDDLLAWVEERAKKGCKLIAIDPVTAAQQSDKPWIADGKFLMKLRSLSVEYSISILIVTHPRKGTTAPCLNDLAGGAAWQRFSQVILWIEHHKHPKDVCVRSCFGSHETGINRTVHICKARNAPGAGLQVGFTFGGKSLIFEEQGIIRKKDKQVKEAG